MLFQLRIPQGNLDKVDKQKKRQKFDKLDKVDKLDKEGKYVWKGRVSIHVPKETSGWCSSASLFQNYTNISIKQTRQIIPILV